MASKWSTLKGKLPEVPEDSTRLDLLHAEQDKHSGKPLVELTKEYNSRRDELNAIKEREKELNLEVEALERLIVKALNDSGSDIWRGNGYSFSESVEPYPSVQNSADVVRWVKENGMEDLLTLNYQRLSSIVKEHITEGNVDIETEVLGRDAEGNEITRETIKTKIPGVNVFLKSGLSRRKAGK